MTQNEKMKAIVSQSIDQALASQFQAQPPLPKDQEEALRKMLDAVHDLFEQRKKIKPQYINQVRNKFVLKCISEMTNASGGNIK